MAAALLVPPLLLILPLALAAWTGIAGPWLSLGSTMPRGDAAAMPPPARPPEDGEGAARER